MLAGVVLFLAAEALMLRSWFIAASACVFCATATAFFVPAEEPGLLRRFGDDYAPAAHAQHHAAHVACVQYEIACFGLSIRR